MIRLKSFYSLCGNSSGVEHNLAKVGVASSNLVSRSIFRFSDLTNFTGNNL